jgi:hypothetical protein
MPDGSRGRHGGEDGFDQNVAVQAADADAFSWESRIADFQAARGASITPSRRRDEAKLPVAPTRRRAGHRQ